MSLWVRDLPKPEPRYTPQRPKEQAKLAVGELSARELFPVGVGLYWAEGGKDKPVRPPRERRLRQQRPQHDENADAAGAEEFWAELVRADRAFNKTTLKGHNPKTVRKNAGDSSRGCLAIKVLKSADLYRRIEGSWYGIVLGADSAT